MISATASRHTKVTAGNVRSRGNIHIRKRLTKSLRLPLGKLRTEELYHKLLQYAREMTKGHAKEIQTAVYPIKRYKRLHYKEKRVQTLLNFKRVYFV